MAECKSRNTSSVELLLTLNDQEATALRGMMQNPINPERDPDQESKEERAVREAVFFALEKVT